VGIISWALWGLFVGLFARLLRPGRQAIGCWWTILLGVVGSLVGGFIATQLLDIGDTDSFDFGSFVIAVLTSTILLAVWERIERALPDRERDDQGRAGI
jgi:uncharacterized membrane protein YeaQ/YmgE (transglycosylase-associated protein family)